MLHSHSVWGTRTAGKPTTSAPSWSLSYVQGHSVKTGNNLLVHQVGRLRCPHKGICTVQKGANPLYTDRTKQNTGRGAVYKTLSAKRRCVCNRHPGFLEGLAQDQSQRLSLGSVCSGRFLCSCLFVPQNIKPVK